MKKFKLLPLILVIVLSVSIFSGCGEHYALTTADFKSIMEEKGFSVEEEAPNNHFEGMVSVLEADCVDYTLQYCEFETEENAIAAFDDMIAKLDKIDGKKTLSKTTNSSDYSYRAFAVNQVFYVVSRVENTIVTTSARETYHNHITEMLEELGY